MSALLHAVEAADPIETLLLPVGQFKASHSRSPNCYSKLSASVCVCRHQRTRQDRSSESANNNNCLDYHRLKPGVHRR